MKKIALIVVLIAVIFLVSGIYFSSHSPNKISPQQNNDSDNFQNPPEIEIANPNHEYFVQSVNQFSENVNQSCYDEYLSYSIKKLDIIKSCKSSDCLEFNFQCPLEIRNLDYSTPGIFNLSFEFYNDNLLLNSVPLEISLDPRQQTIISANYSSANNITCTYRTVKIPTKPICGIIV